MRVRRGKKLSGGSYAALGAIFSAALVGPAARPAMAQAGQNQPAACVSGQICTSSGSDVTALAPLVQQYVGSYLAANGVNGATVGVSWKGRRTYFGYGNYDEAGTLPYSSDTIVEIGSITKVFTTALFAEAIAEGRVQPKEQLRDFASLLHLPSLNWCTGLKNLQQLADYSSGMPRLPDVPSPSPNIKTYPVPDFLAWLSQWQPAAANNNSSAACAADADYLYSNASVGILGIILGEVYHQNWPSLIQERITVPLGMSSTSAVVPQDKWSRVAQGHASDNTPAQPWPLYAWFAAGALRSDTADMLSFGEAALGNGTVNGISAQKPAVAALEAAIGSATAPIYSYTQNGNTNGQGLAWEILTPTTASQAPIAVKNGGTSGFNTVIAINSTKDLAVFVALPKNGTDAQSVGVNLVRHIGSGN